ncbi:MAG: beta-lactamase domain-containing protein [Ignavibacteria bacterium]|nr:MAG: beta-lactamase domain-containing protein [Ignavibacteria bacterium]KAF0161511.1 MAG: beta-lactamase domain-containing protein [Ignavibacteria bacterium]
MTIGPYKLDIIETGSFALDGGAMFGVVPKLFWQMTNPPDELNRITLNARNLLLSAENQNILIDTGIGNFWDEKFNRIYGVDYSEFSQQKSFEKAGVDPEKVTDVILTHLHFDHTGGSTYLKDGNWLPTFPNAVYHIQKKHFEWAINPSEKDKASFIKERFMPLMNEGILKLWEDSEFNDYVELIVVNGHTFNQQLVKISDSSNTVLYCGDLIPTSSHIPVPYVMGYDLQPLITLNEKKDLLPKASEENWYLFFEHDSFAVASTVTKNERGFAVKEKLTELPK